MIILINFQCIFKNIFAGQEQQKEKMKVGADQNATFGGESEFELESGLSYLIF
jgi:hypothetical protein